MPFLQKSLKLKNLDEVLQNKSTEIPEETETQRELKGDENEMDDYLLKTTARNEPFLIITRRSPLCQDKSEGIIEE